jgi:phosphinothricin acetyltransferase
MDLSEITMGEMIIREPTPDDEAAIAAIDAQGLASGHASFRDQTHDWQSFQKSFMMGRALALVAQDDKGIAAWAGVSVTSTRAVYQGVGEVSIYVADDRQGFGVGRRLLDAMIQHSEEAGYWTLIAQIFPENEASLKLHAALGFEVLGTRRKLGKMTYGPMAGQWRDVVMMERRSAIVG